MKDMKKTIYRLLGSAAALFMVLSCNMDLIPTSDIVYDENEPAIQKASDITSFEQGIHAYFRSIHQSTYYYVSDIMTDGFNATVDFGNNFGPIHRTDADFTAGDQDVEDVWGGYYVAISKFNQAIAAANSITDAGLKESAQTFKGYAFFYRAYAYFNLVQIFGRRWSDGQDKLACVLRLTGEEPDNLDRATVGEVYKQIYADLDEAISLFNSSGRANKRSSAHIMDLDVAYAIYARVALTREDWNNALKYAQLVRKNYPLMSVADERAGFCNPNGEWIWYIYGAEDETLYYYDYFAYAAYNASTSTMRNYPLLISKHLFDQIPETDIRRAFWLDPAGYEGTFNTNTMKASAQTSKNKLWVYGQQYAAQDGRAGILSNSCVFAYMNFKIKNWAQPGIGHMCLFRGSEMLLIEAEAQYRLGNEAATRDLLVELNATSKRDPEYTCDKSGQDLMDEIKLYRGIELWGEGFNWFDLKRWGDSISRQKYADGGNWMSQYAITFGPNEKNNWTWTIPQSETNYNKGITTTAN